MTEETIDLRIEDVVYQGRALAHHEGMVTFVRGALPGERVRAVIVSRRRRYALARLVDVVEAAPDRCPPACPLAAAPGVRQPCPGCAYQHTGYERELDIKQRQLCGMLTHKLPGIEACIKPPVGSPKSLGYRNKIVLREGDAHGRRVIGYTADDNRSIVDTPACPLAMDPINTALAAVRGNLDAAGTTHRHTFRYTPADGVVHFRDRERPSSARLTESTRVGDVYVPARGFFQVNPGLADLLIDAVTQRLRSSRADRVIDAFCGVGVFAFAARQAGAREVLGFDSDRRAIRAAKRNARELGFGDSAYFLASDSDRGMDKAFQGVDSDSVTLLVDPPRTGLQTRDIRAIGKGRPKCIVYVSCAADTLTRDLVRLRQAGYAATRVQLFDMFPRTALFETLVMLERA